MHRRRFIAALGASAAATAASGRAAAAGESTSGGGSAAAGSPPYEVERSDHRIASWDGTELAATVFEPAAEGSFPAVLATHGWGGSRDQNFGEGERYATDGYVLLTYDSRGFGESDGEVGVDGPDEVRDVSALLDWLAARPSVALDAEGDPRAGMFGGSYAGGIQLEAAAHDDRLDAVVPEICWHDLNYSLVPNDVVKTVWGAGLYGVGAGASRQHEVQSGDVQSLPYGMDPAVTRAFAEGVGLNGYGEESEAYFALRSPATKLDRIAASGTPALLVQGWTDHLFVPNEAIWNFAGLRARDAEVRLLLYRDGHEQIPVDGSYEQAVSVADAARKAWLDAHLKGGRARARARRRLDDLLPDAVTYYAPQAAGFRSADGLPPSDASRVELALGDAANASGDRSVVANGPGSNSYVVSESAETPGTSVAFDFPAAALGATDGPVEVLGPARLDLRARPLGQEAFLFVKPYRVTSSGPTHVDDQVTPVGVGGGPADAGTVRERSLELVAFQRDFHPGDALRLVFAGQDSAFNTARRGAGAAVRHDSTVSVPVRPR